VVGAILQSIGGLGLFLLGMSLMTDGLKTLAGSSLQRVLRRFTRSPTSGAISGAVVTAVVQSSSAITITVVGLVGAGVMTFPQALGIIFGANVGTTATGWLVAIFGFKVPLGSIAMPLVLGGVLLRLFARDWLAAIGISLAGFAVIFVGIDTLQAGMSGMQGLVTPSSFPGDDLLGLLKLIGLGALVTVVTQSSSAGVATALTAVHTGTIGFGQAAAMVIGMNVGTTVTAVLATIGGSAAVRRTGYAHMVYNVMVSAIGLGLLTPYIRVTDMMGLDGHEELYLVGFHTLFNTMGLFLILPATRRFGRLMERLIPSDAPVLSRYLEPRLLQAPGQAVDAVYSTIQEITALAVNVLRPIFAGKKQSELRTATAPLNDALQEAQSFLDDLSRRSSTKEQSRKALHLLYAADHLARLVVRLGRSDRIATIGATEALRRATNELDTIAARMESWIREPDGEDLERDAKQAWRSLETHNESYRREVMELTASGRISTAESIRRLDAMRWIVRVSHHLWRLIHHIEAARAKGSVTREPAAEHETDT
jgi:phosphate:Na+ symporter